uniref:CHCH domain-containing protein n=1 Tax=Picea sitchensis TaxID=3332 RepID=A9NJS3_PICSI|nr:unknown [Picea sitchensis]
MEDLKTHSVPSTHEGEVNEEDESLRQLKDCAQLYLNLQDCLIETNRDWRACQKEVKLLKTCHERKNKLLSPSGGAGMLKGGSIS